MSEVYKEMERAGCTPDRKAREMLHDASVILEQRGCEYFICSWHVGLEEWMQWLSDDVCKMLWQVSIEIGTLAILNGPGVNVPSVLQMHGEEIIWKETEGGY